MQGGDDLARQTVHTDHFADGVFDAEKLVANGAADGTHIGGSIHIVLRKNGALIHVPTLDIKIFWRHATVGGVPVLVAVDDLNWVVDVGRNALDERNLVLDR